MAHLHHHPRQPPLPAPDRPDTRAHDPHGPPPHHLLQSSHALQPPHMPPNGMPAVGHSPAPSAHNGPPPRRQEHPHPVAESLQRLARLNEDTWILIGGFNYV